MRRLATPSELELLRSRLAFQWDWRVAHHVLSNMEEYMIDLVRGKIRYILLKGKVYLTIRPNDGYMTPSVRAAERIREASDPPKYRIIIREDREIKGSILARDIIDIDYELRAGDEVLIVNRDDKLIGVGRLRIAPRMLKGLKYGEVARLRSKVK